jgi:hypothetical protein
VRVRADLLYAVLSVLWLATLVVELVRRQHAGRVLFDLGGNPYAGMRTGFGVLMLLVGIGFMLLTPGRHTGESRTSFGGFGTC